MAQVARDRHEHLALALGQHEVVPAEAPARAAWRARRCACSTPAVRRGRGPRRSARRRREAAASRAASAPSAIWPTERRNFAATSPTVLGAGEGGPDLATLGERRQRHLHDEHGGVSQRNGGLARGRADDAAPAAGREGRLDPDALARIEPARARRSRARRRRARPRARRRAAHPAPPPGDVQQHERTLERDGQQGGRVRPGDHDRQAALDRQQGAQLCHGRRPSGVVGRQVEPAQAAVARRLVERGPSRYAARRSAVLSWRSASGTGPPVSISRTAPRAAERGVAARSSRARRSRRCRRPASSLATRRGLASFRVTSSCR